jgi:hypothetical protein
MMGIVLNIIGGTMIGLSANALSLIVIGVIQLGVGIVLEIRVLAKHHHELQKLRQDLEKAAAQNAETLKKMEQQQGVIDSATTKLNEATKEIGRAKNEIEDIQKKSFSRSGSLSLSKPILLICYGYNVHNDMDWLLLLFQFSVSGAAAGAALFLANVLLDRYRGPSLSIDKEHFLELVRINLTLSFRCSRFSSRVE